jgi:GntR family transcriptional repressor for pyruvate dehydrogenase complex
LRVPKASDVLAAEIRKLIVVDGLADGTPLPSEKDLIEQWGLSRGTVREGLRLLETQGLITISRGRRGGIRVRHPDIGPIMESITVQLALMETPLRDLYEFRCAVEPAAARLAARNGSSDEKQALLEAAEFELKAPLDEVPRFHKILIDASGNQVFQLSLAGLEDVIHLHARIDSVKRRDLDEISTEHRKIARAIARGSETTAERLALQHLESEMNRLERSKRLDAPIIPRDRWDIATLPGITTVARLGRQGETHSA